MDHCQSSIIHRPSSVRGFSLIEVLIATILVGLSIAALVVANGSFTMANGAGTDLSTAEFLVEQIRELTTLTGYDDLHDLDGAGAGTVFSPPIDASRAPLNDFGVFSQRVTVENVNPSDFGQVVDDHTSDFVRITVQVLQNGREITSASWIRARY